MTPDRAPSGTDRLTGLAALAARLQSAAPGPAWRRLQRRFDLRPQRERLLLIAAAAAVLLLLADSLWLGPALTGFKTARTQQRAAVGALRALQDEVARLQGQGRQQAGQQRAELDSWRQRVRAGEAGLRGQEDGLVGADQMVGLLEQLLLRQGQLRLRGLRSLDRVDLLAGGGAGPQPPQAAPPSAQASAAADAAPALYRHGVELTLEGGFADLLQYLRRIEALPQRLLWGGIRLQVEQHPTAVLTLRVYTLSRERHWLEL